MRDAGTLGSRGPRWEIGATVLDLLRPHRPGARSLLSAVLLSAIIAGALLVALRLSWLDFPEMKLLDWRFRVRGLRPAPEEVLLVALDDRTMSRARRLSPVPRDLLAAIVRRLSQGGARTVVLDVELPDRLPGDEDRKLRDALLDAANVILPATINPKGRLIRPHPYLESVAAGAGLAYVEETDVDHVVRWHKPVQAGMPSLALAAYAHFSGSSLEDLLAAPSPAALGRRLGQTLDGEGRLLIDYVGPQGSIPRVSAADLLDGGSPPSVRGRLVIVGGTWGSARDLHFVPFADWRADLDTRMMTGVEVQANCIAALLTRPPLRTASPWVNGLLLLTAVVLASTVMVFFQPTAAALLSIGLAAIWVEAGVLLFVRDHLFVRMAPPLAGILLAYLASALVTERRAWRLRRQFRRYVGPPVADRIATTSDSEIGRMGKERVATILFSDIRGYTRFASTLAPEAVVDFLNRYFARMTSAALAHNGFVDQFIGDALMVIFGIFSRDETGAEGAWEAACAALAMRDAMETLRKKDPDFHGIHIGIGVHTGRIVIGEIGTPARADFTAIGSAVNLASRIADQTRRIFAALRERGAPPADVILMSHITHALIAGKVEAHSLGPATIRGLEEEEILLWELRSLRL